MWALIKQMTNHLGAIVHKVKQIRDDVKEIRDSRRAKMRPQVGVQTKEKKMVEVGVEAKQEGEKGSEDGDKDGEGEEEMEE